MFSKFKNLALCALFGLLLAFGLRVEAETDTLGQTLYPTPEAAVQALIDAAADDTPGALQSVLGPMAAELGSGDPVSDALEREAFVRKALDAAAIELTDDGTHGILVIGSDNWPFAIPLVKQDQGWGFDTPAGIEEIYNRRIGRNELHAIATLRAGVAAQREYAAQDHDGDGVKEYARRFLSQEGQQDGLYWPTAEGEPTSPLGPLVAEASASGYSAEDSATPRPYHGYFYRILEAQGPSAPGGARSYLDDGQMTGGFGFLAYPAEYDNSGIMTFIVGPQGIVFQKDLGEQTAELAPRIRAYDPDRSWEPVLD